MVRAKQVCKWKPGSAPVAVVMISLNEGHNMDAVLKNLQGWAQEVFLVDSYSQDNTLDIALDYGVHVVQRKFRGFGDQWNFALQELPITAPWTMKLDPDERLTDELKSNILMTIEKNESSAILLKIRLWFMGRILPVELSMVRLWRTGDCHFSDVGVNEYPLVSGNIMKVDGVLEHHDSPHLDHWWEKQNRYTTAEAIIAYKQLPLSVTPCLLGSPLQRRMWLKKHFSLLPCRFFILFLYNWIWLGTYRAGWVGYVWARLRSDVMRLIEYKCREIELTGRLPEKLDYGFGSPDPRVRQYE